MDARDEVDARDVAFANARATAASSRFENASAQFAAATKSDAIADASSPSRGAEDASAAVSDGEHASNQPSLSFVSARAASTSLRSRICRAFSVFSSSAFASDATASALAAIAATPPSIDGDASVDATAAKTFATCARGAAPRARRPISAYAHANRAPSDARRDARGDAIPIPSS